MVSTLNWSWSSITSRQLEMTYGVCLAVFAAMLAIFDLKGGAVATEEIKLVVGQNNAYQWYQAKSIKATLAKSQRDMLNVVSRAPLSTAQADEVHQQKTILEKKIREYEREQEEILLGSEAVGKENWVQKVDGHLGLVIGAKKYEEKLRKVAELGAGLDTAILWLQLSLVLGALGLLMSRRETKLYLLAATMICGGGGVYFGSSTLLTITG